MSEHWIVELEQGVWLAGCEGDPGRTLVKSNATHYLHHRLAEIALMEARKMRGFSGGKIEHVQSALGEKG